VARLDRSGGRLAKSGPQNERLGLVERRGRRGLRREGRELSRTEPHPEATNAHLELEVDRRARPQELREGLSARRADEGRGAAVVKRCLPQMIDEGARRNLTKDGEGGGACSASSAQPDQAVTPGSWFKETSTERTGQRFQSRYPLLVGYVGLDRVPPITGTLQGTAIPLAQVGCRLIRRLNEIEKRVVGRIGFPDNVVW